MHDIFRSLHSHLHVLLNEDLKGTRTEYGFKRTFISLFVQDVETFTSTMFLYVDQLEKKLDKDEFQEDESMNAFWVLNKQCQQFIYLQFSLDYDSRIINKYFSEYTRIEAKEFRDTLLQHMSSVKKSIAEKNIIRDKSSRTEPEKHDTKSRFVNDTHAEDADSKHINDKEPMVEVHLTTEHNVLANEQQHAKQPEFNNEGRVDQDAEQCQVKSPLLDPSPDNKITEFSNQSLESENKFLQQIVAQFQNDFSRMEAHCVNLELKYQNQALKSKQHGYIHILCK
ncbi:hypothetical protein Tco_0409920 [Tanacetum coccineum]